MSPRYWKSPETVGLNRLPMLNIEQYEKLSLDGTWRFQLLTNPSAQPRKRWNEIEAPGLWTSPTTANEALDFLADGLPDENPTGIYERSFEIPGSWYNKRIVLQLGGVESVASVYINDQLVGVAKDSRLASEFLINEFLWAGKNTIRVHVTQWADSMYLEDIDHQWHGGISRSIKLYATSEVFIEQITTTSELSNNYSTGLLSIDATIGSVNKKSYIGYSLKVTVEGLAKNKVASRTTTLNEDSPSQGNHINLELNLGKVLPWSSENPKLYTVNLELIDPLGNIVQISSQKVGFRSIELDGDSLFVNGKEVNLYGFGSESSPAFINRAATRDELRQLLIELKRRNITALRSSFFIADPVFLDLCDELGFYVIAEANIHPGAAYEIVASDSQYLAPLLDRASRMLQRDISHPSVIAWSLNADHGYGINFEVASQYIELFDPSRPLIDFNEVPLPEFEAPTPVIVISAIALLSGAFEIFNNQIFNDTSEFKIAWRIEVDGQVIEHVDLELKSIAPQESQRLQIKYPKLIAGKKNQAKIFFTVSCRSSSTWSSAHSGISVFEFELRRGRKS